MTAFRVFSGWDSRQAEAAAVFAYSVRQNATIPVECFRLINGGKAAKPQALVGRLDEVACLKSFQRQGTTEFTYTRFLVPWFCDFEGRALYADGCDQLCLGDVAELADFDMGGAAVCVVKHPPNPQVVPPEDRPRVWTSLMLLDCSKLEFWTPAWVESEPDKVLMRLRPLRDDAIGDLPPDWNFLVGEGAHTDRLLAGKPGILHWTYLSDPKGGSWIDRSGSALWAEWRERWRAAR